jgi:hypothetical protein
VRRLGRAAGGGGAAAAESRRRRDRRRGRAPGGAGEGAEEDASQQRGLGVQWHSAESCEHAGEVRRGEEQEREAAPQPARVV